MGSLLRRLALLVAVLAIAPPAAAALRPVSRTYSSGDLTQAGVRAELTCRTGFTNVRLTVFRAGSSALAERLRPVCRYCEVVPSGGTSTTSLTVRDLGGGRTPEVVVWANTGGAHCCAVAYVYRLEARGARLTAKSFGNPGVTLRPIGGVPLFVSGDDRFAYAFTSFAASSWPVQAWRWRPDRFADVTRSYPSLVRADAA